MTYNPQSKRFNPLLDESSGYFGSEMNFFTSTHSLQLPFNPPFAIHNVSDTNLRSLAEDDIRERYGNILMFLSTRIEKLKLGEEFDNGIDLKRLYFNDYEHVYVILKHDITNVPFTGLKK
jgi:hypothetical protein